MIDYLFYIFFGVNLILAALNFWLVYENQRLRKAIKRMQEAQAFIRRYHWRQNHERQ